MLSDNTNCKGDIDNSRLVPVIEGFMSSATTTPVLSGSNTQSFLVARSRFLSANAKFPRLGDPLGIVKGTLRHLHKLLKWMRLLQRLIFHKQPLLNTFPLPPPVFKKALLLTRKVHSFNVTSPGKGVLGLIFCWVCAAGLPEPIPHYSLFGVNYRPHLSHFWANI